MLRSLYSGVSGLRAHQTKMDVIGNNIANVNTFGFKASRVTFSDIYYQTMRNATAGTSTSGGNNPSQIGYGASVGTIDINMSRSGFQTTGKGMDLSIAGEGFFQVQDKAGNILYTRAGIFDIDNNGNLVDANGNFVLGVTGDPSTQVTAASNKIQIVVPRVENAASSAEKTLLGSKVTIDATNVGADGNMTINFVHGTPPTASLSGNNLTVTFDQTANYPDLASLQSAIDSAISAGGVTLPAGAINISVDPAPTATAAAASNSVTFSSVAGTPATATDTVGALTINAAAAANGITVNGVTINITSGAGPDSATWTGNTLDIALTDASSYDNAAINALIAGAAGAPSPEASAITVDFTGSVVGTDLNAATLVLAGGVDDTSETLTVTAGDQGKTGNNISIKYNTVIGVQGTDDSAEWDGDTLTFNLVEGATYSDTQLNTLLTAANTTAGISAGDYRDISLVLSNPVSTADLADHPFRLGGGDNTYFENIAGLLGTVKLDGGTTESDQTVGNLSSISIGNDGTITATHSVHGQLTLGRIDLVTFDNPAGLEASGNTCFTKTVASGDAKVCLAGLEGSGDIVSGSLEMSNVDLAQEFADMITTQRGFQANSRIITTSDEILQELVNLKR